MLVEVREVSQDRGPIATVIRLQALDCCHMRVAKPAQHLRSLPIKAVFASFDDKLCSGVLNPGVKLGETRHEIIEGRPKVSADFTEQNSGFIGDGNYIVVDRCLEPSRGSIHRDSGSGNGLRCVNVTLDFLQLIEMFPCPIDEGIGGTQ